MTNPDDAVYGHGAENRHCCGLSKREEFAKAAMIGIMFWDATVNEKHDTGKIEELANSAVKMADALITALNKPVLSDNEKASEGRDGG